MKKALIAAAAVLLSATLLSAQDLSVATETFNNGVTTLQGGDTPAALALFQEALALGEACGDEGAELVSNCKNIIPGLYVSIAKGLINEDDYDGAIEKLQEAIAVAGQYGVEGVSDEAGSLITTANLRKGGSLLKNKDFAGAAEALKNVVAADASNGQAWLLLGQAELQNGNNAAAIEALKNAAGNGKEAQAGKLLGNAYLKEGSALLKDGKTAEAIAAFEQSNAYAESANAYKMLANAYNKTGNKKGAINAASKYLELNPNAKDAATYKQLIEVLSK